MNEMVKIMLLNLTATSFKISDLISTSSSSLFTALCLLFLTSPSLLLLLLFLHSNRNVK